MVAAPVKLDPAHESLGGRTDVARPDGLREANSQLRAQVESMQQLLRRGEERRRAMLHIMVDMNEANRRLAEGKTRQNLALVAEFLGEEVAALEDICWPFQPTDGRIRADHLTQFQEWMLERGWIDRIIGTDELIDPAFLEEIGHSPDENP